MVAMLHLRDTIDRGDATLQAIHSQNHGFQARRVKVFFIRVWFSAPPERFSLRQFTRPLHFFLRSNILEQTVTAVN